MQTVNDLLTMYIGAASQHALRTTFVPFEEAVSFDNEIVSYWSQLAGRDVTTPLFHLPLSMGGLGVGSAVHRHAAAPWTAWHSIIPTLMEATESPDIDSPVRPQAHPTESASPTTNYVIPTNECSLPPPQIIGRGTPNARVPKGSGQHDPTNDTPTTTIKPLN